jgi:hypothetical protein
MGLQCAGADREFDASARTGNGTTGRGIRSRSEPPERRPVLAHGLIQFIFDKESNID